MKVLVKSIAFYFLFALVAIHIHAQPPLVNYHLHDDTRRDTNQAYINQTAAKYSVSGKDTFFAEAKVFRGRDTVPCRIYIGERPRKKFIFGEAAYLYIIAKFENDSACILTPKDISGYTIGDRYMKTHRSIAGSDTSYFFIERIAQGPLTLYRRERIPSDDEFIYYFEKQGDPDLLYLAPFRQHDVYRVETYNKDAPVISKYSGMSEDEFTAAFAEYLKDCPIVRNKLQSKIYSLSDVELMVSEYNACKK